MKLSHTLFRTLLRSRLPLTAGALTVTGLHRPVTIRRDSYGIPYIEAENEDDAWFALGFCQGQDRSFQLETLLRTGRGTLSALIGTAGLPIDRLSRRIGFHRSARAQEPALSAATRQMLEAYARGVNAAATKGLPAPDHPFALLRSEPTPYTATDILATLKLISFMLASNWDSELLRLKILVEDGAAALRALSPHYLAGHPLTAPVGAEAGPAINALAEDLAAFRRAAARLGLSSGGSNNWAIAGEKSAGGGALLANDLHLAPSLPPHWYLAHIRTPEWTAAGASFAGAPGISVGWNGYGAWGVTAGHTDNTDLYLEELSEDGGRVRGPEGWVEAEVIVETIEVKGGEPVEERITVTPRGPVISPGLHGRWPGDMPPPGNERSRRRQRAAAQATVPEAGESGALGLSLQAIWLQSLPVTGLTQLHHAQSFAEFREFFAEWPVLPLNMLWAGRDGDIGWQLAGQLPRRRRGYGLLPLPGWVEESGWEDELLPLEEMPFLHNPPEGFVATANQKPVAGPADTGDQETAYFGFDWLDGYRLSRIRTLLAEPALLAAQAPSGGWTLDAMEAVQRDQQSVVWPAIRAAVLSAPAADGDVEEAQKLLRAWNGAVVAGSSGAALFEFFLAEIVARIIRARAPHAADWLLQAGTTALTDEAQPVAKHISHLLEKVVTQPSGWFEEGWPLAIAAALGDSYRRLRRMAGKDSADWQWGTLRKLLLKHPMGEQPPFGAIYNLGPFPFGGDTNTIAQASVRLDDPTANPSVIPSMRLLVDAGNPSHNRVSLPGGQSGNPLSPHYADLLPLWREGGGATIAWTEEEVAAVAEETLRLEPS
ncbi:MAG: penicillin acylase family protein [Candidatus Promineifilaceae bacterium]|nr:penicillin acylase family protein [Candidatus Promineifilaceae bacterium]